MKKEAMIRARIEPDVKEQAEAIFKSLGLNASEAIGLFYHQVRLQQGLPFDLRLKAKGLKSSTANFARTALVKQAKSMSTQDRLTAFLNHSSLMIKMKAAGSKNKKNKEGVKNARERKRAVSVIIARCDRHP